MLRNNLLRGDYHFVERDPPKDLISALWVALGLFLIIATVSFSFALMLNSNPGDGSALGAAVAINIIAIAAPGIYYLLKYALTAAFCSDRRQNVSMTILKEVQMPVCGCKEALRIWQAVLVYLLPAAIVYLGLCAIIIIGSFDAHYIIITLFMSFFISFDLVLVIYIIYVKAKYNPDYIAVNHHVYSLTLYTRAYIRRKKNKVKVAKS